MSAKRENLKHIFDREEIFAAAIDLDRYADNIISALAEVLAEQNIIVRDSAIARAEDLIHSRRRMIEAEQHAKWMERKEADIAELYQLQLVRNAELQSALDACRAECAALQAAVDATGEHVALSEPDEYSEDYFDGLRDANGFCTRCGHKTCACRSYYDGGKR